MSKLEKKYDDAMIVYNKTVDTLNDAKDKCDKAKEVLDIAKSNINKSNAIDLSRIMMKHVKCWDKRVLEYVICADDQNIYKRLSAIGLDSIGPYGDVIVVRKDISLSNLKNAIKYLLPLTGYNYIYMNNSPSNNIIIYDDLSINFGGKKDLKLKNVEGIFKFIRNYL